MKNRSSAFILMLIVLALAGCEGCEKEVIRYVVALGSVKMVKKRIAGSNYVTLATPAGSDKAVANNGFLCVTHPAKCNSWIFSSGNDGTDIFFDNGHPLPAGCSVESVSFRQYWPVGTCSDGLGNWAGAGSYRAKRFGGGGWPEEVRWNNTCVTDLAGKDLCYSVSFVILMPEGTDLGEPTFDPLALSPCLPSGYLEYHPHSCLPVGASCTQDMDAEYALTMQYRVGDGPIIYQSTLPAPSNGCGGTLKGIKNPNLYMVTLVGSGSSRVDLPAGASTTASDLSTLYSSSTPGLPVVIAVHPTIPIPNPASFSFYMTVSYSYKN